MKKLIPALAVSALLVAGCGTTGEPSATANDTGAPSTPSVSAAGTTGSAPAGGGPAAQGSLPDGLLPMDDPALSRNGETVTFDDGTTVTADVRRVTLTTPDGRTARGTLPTEAESGVEQHSVEFAQAGTGYLVQQGGGEFSDTMVVLLLGGEVVVAGEPEDVPFGYVGNETDGTLAETWTTDGGAGGLFTRVRVDEGESLSEDTYRVYSWEVSIDDDGTNLAPTDLGIVCFDDAAGTYEAC